MSCENITLNTEKGKFCFNGEIDGFALSQEAMEVSISSLQTKAWWDAQIVDSSSRITTLIGSDDSEITASEITEYKPKRGGAVQTDKSSNMYTIKYKDTECLRKSLDRLNGKTMYALFFTTSNYVQGIRVGANNMKFVKSYISVSNEVNEGVRLLVVKFTFALDFETLYSEIKLENGFDISEMETLTGLNLFGVSCSNTELVVNVLDCGYTAVDGLTTTNFTAYDVTSGTAITPSGVVDDGDGTYTLTGTYTTAHDIKGVYAGPGASNLYIETSSESVTVV